MTGDSENSNGIPFRNGIILNLDKRMDDVLHGIGKIQGELEALRNEGDRRSRDIRKMERRFAKALDAVNARIDGHLKDHSDSAEVMGVIPFSRKYFRRHWRFFFFIFMLGQAMFAALALRFGVEKTLRLFFGF